MKRGENAKMSLVIKPLQIPLQFFVNSLCNSTKNITFAEQS